MAANQPFQTDQVRCFAAPLAAEGHSVSCLAVV